MLYTTVGNETIAKIALGTGAFGAGIAKETAFAILDAYYAQGGNLIDTARIYADGCSEQVVGAWVRERGVRNRVILSTKGAHPAVSDWSSRLNEAALVSDLEESLQALGCDCADIYYLHRDDPSKEVSEIMPLLHRFVMEGKVRFLGASNWTVRRLEEANRFARENGLTEFTYSQILWNYAKVNREGVPDQTLVVMDGEEYAGYRKNGMPVMAYTSQAQGLFSHIARHGFEGISESLRRMYDNEQTRQRAEQVLAIHAETGLSPTAIALCPLLYNEENAIPILGISRVERLKESLQCLEVPERYRAVLRGTW